MRVCVTKETDCYYSRDLSYGRVKALAKLFGMIRDGTFTPDASRANYFAKRNPFSSATPVHVVMQPFTPVPPGRAPATPNPAQTEAVAIEPSKAVEEVDIADGWTDVKDEQVERSEPAACVDAIIEIQSDTDSSASESDSDACMRKLCLRTTPLRDVR